MYTLRTLAKRDHCHRLWLKRATSSGLNNDLNSSICIKKILRNLYTCITSTNPQSPTIWCFYIQIHMLSLKYATLCVLLKNTFRHGCRFATGVFPVLIIGSALRSLISRTSSSFANHRSGLCPTLLPECCMQLVHRTFQHLVYLIACIQPCLYLTCTCFHLLVNLPAFCPWPQVCLFKGIIRGFHSSVVSHWDPCHKSWHIHLSV